MISEDAVIKEVKWRLDQMQMLRSGGYSIGYEINLTYVDALMYVLGFEDIDESLLMTVGFDEYVLIEREMIDELYD